MLNILKFESSCLCDIFYEANRKNTPLELIKESNQHIKFFKEYLGADHGLNALFYVVENDYINVDYLTDYSYYYSKNYNDYGNKCNRIHFFTFENHDLELFKNSLTSKIINVNKVAETADCDFWEKYYLGFIVVRPIPNNFIGYTLLKHYNYDQNSKLYNQKRNYWATKEYPVNFFGKKLKIDTLAFMSQDGNVAACATISVWSMLQMAVENYTINIKSPYEITKDAGVTIHNGNRLIPNTGLDLISICVAITKNNLAPEIREFIPDTQQPKDRSTNNRIKELVNAYSPLKLPIVFGLVFVKKGHVEGHAVSIAGYSISNRMSTRRNKFSNPKDDSLFPKMRAHFIDKLYTHDDQWGPFSKMEFKGPNRIASSWNDKDKSAAMFSSPTALIISVFQKVRIPYEEIKLTTIGLDYFVSKALDGHMKRDRYWDIKLYYSNDFKDIVKNSALFDITNVKQKEILLQFLTMCLPKYIWVSTLYFGDFRVMEFIFDATALRGTNSLLFSLSYYENIFVLFDGYLSGLNSGANKSFELKEELEGMLRDSLSGFVNKFKFLSKGA